MKEDRPFMVVPITRCTPIARARWRALLSIPAPLSPVPFAVVLRSPRVLDMRAQREGGEKMHRRPTNLTNRARGLSPPG